jgi:hypothetical protein
MATGRASTSRTMAFVSDTQSLGIRRGRLVLSGDVTDHVYLYLQSDYMAGVGGVNALQARDVYADVSLDPAREFRVRLGSVQGAVRLLEPAILAEPLRAWSARTP